MLKTGMQPGSIITLRKPDEPGLRSGILLAASGSLTQRLWPAVRLHYFFETRRLTAAFRLLPSSPGLDAAVLLFLLSQRDIRAPEGLPASA